MSALEKSIEQRFVALAKSRGWLALKLSGAIGFPDRTVLVPGEGMLPATVVFLEFKTERGSPSRKQLWWLQRLREMGFHAAIVRSARDAERCVEEALQHDN